MFSRPISDNGNDSSSHWFFLFTFDPQLRAFPPPYMPSVTLAGWNLLLSAPGSSWMTVGAELSGSDSLECGPFWGRDLPASEEGAAPRPICATKTHKRQKMLLMLDVFYFTKANIHF